MDLWQNIGSVSTRALGPNGGGLSYPTLLGKWMVKSHIWRVFITHYQYIFLERIDLINKQNWDPCVKCWVESGVVIVILYVFNNFTIKFLKCKMERKYLKIPRLMILKMYHLSKAPMYTYWSHLNLIILY